MNIISVDSTDLFYLYPIQNVFWALQRTCIYKATSWDRLHAYHGGLFSDHLWEEVKTIADGLGKELTKLIDNQYVFYFISIL